LLQTPLKAESGFDGVVISDWTAVRSLASAEAAQDLVMPGPDGPWGEALVEAVRDGRIPEAVIDEKVRRILLLAARVGALEGFTPVQATPVVVEDGVAFAREAAAEGTVLLANDGILPLEPAQLRRVAVIGHNARQARTQGGGSATVVAEKVVTPLDAIRAALPAAEVSYAVGAIVQQGLAELPLDQIVNPATGEPGALVRFLDAHGNELLREDRRSTGLFYLGGDAPTRTAARFEVSLSWTPDTTGEVLLGFASVGRGRVFVDDALRLEETAEAAGAEFGAAFLAPPAVTTPIAVDSGTPVALRIEFDLGSREPIEGLEALFSLVVGVEADASDPDGLLDEAVGSAADADVAVVVVGTNSQVESEGFDRTNLALPGRQDDLVAAVAATGTPTIVVVNAGSPVLLPWRDQVSAVLVSYFGGQEMGNALADVLLGTVEPGGRLPTTWPKTESDTPVLDVTPVDGKVVYDEGIHIGYRAWLRAEAQPAYAFGHGLGYTTWQLDDLRVSAPAGGEGQVDVAVTNTGLRAGKQVVQVYLSRPDGGVERPERCLAGFATIRAEPRQTVPITVSLPARAFAHWAEGAWRVEPGRYAVDVGTTVDDLPLRGALELSGNE